MCSQAIVARKSKDVYSKNLWCSWREVLYLRGEQYVLQRRQPEVEEQNDGGPVSVNLGDLHSHTAVIYTIIGI
jgi:hypothetical protein